MPERVLILDFGSQYTQLIARRVRELRVYCEIHPCTVADPFVRDFAPSAIILSGGPASTHEAESPRAPPAAFDLGVPVLGVCYGEQTMCAQLGGRVEPSSHREYGRAEIRLDRPSPLFEGILAPGQASTVWMSHGDKVAAIPQGFAPIAQSDTSPFAAIADEARRFYGLQFHPEVVHTAIGPGLLQNFLFRIAGLSGDWSMHAYKEQAIAEAKGQSARFLKVYDEYKKAPDVTRQRLYLETMERILGNAEKLIYDGGSSSGQSNMVPYLPLSELSPRRSASPAPGQSQQQGGAAR